MFKDMPSIGVGVGCTATCAAFPSTNMEAAFGRLHNRNASAFGAGASVVGSIMVDGKAAHVAVQPTPTPIEGISLNIVPKRPAYWGGGGFSISHSMRQGWSAEQGAGNADCGKYLE